MPSISALVRRAVVRIPFFASPVVAGFPSPANDFIDKRLDLNEFLIAHPAATFFVRAEGDSMNGAGIQDGDYLIVDRAIQARNGMVIVAVLNGEFTVKRLRQSEGMVFLEAENPNYKRLEVTEDMDFEVWGVVTSVIHRYDK